MFLPKLIISLLTSLHLWLGGLLPSGTAVVTQVAPVTAGRQAPMPPRPATRVAQAAPRAATPADRAVAQVLMLRGERRAVEAEKSLLAERHADKLDEIDRLKRRKASWRRDRQLKEALADSQQLAAMLSKVDRRLRGIDRKLEAANKTLVKVIRAEIESGSPGPERRKKLVAWYRAARRSMVRQKKIVLPDHRIDPLADPEDLEYQAARIKQSEQELEREIQALLAREKRYHRMVKLRDKSNRAEQMESFDDDRPRRTTGRIGTQGVGPGRNGATGGAEADDAADPSPTSPLDSDPSEGGFTGGSDPTVVLADVVDPGTLNALRRAESSGDPRARARAAKRARAEVKAQLERLRKARSAIERRANKLRRE